MDKVSLEDFVAETLTAIVVGVRRAQTASKIANAFPIAVAHIGHERVKDGAQLVRFSVQIQAEKSLHASTSASVTGAIVSVISGSALIGGEKTATNNSHHTVEFAVPIRFDAAWDENGRR